MDNRGTRRRPCSITSYSGISHSCKTYIRKGKTKGGLYLPDSVQNDIAYLTTVGKVLVVGADAYIDQDKFPNGPWCREGDYVCYGKHSGQKFFYKVIKLILLYDDQISMVVDNPKDLDPTYNLTN